MANVVLKEPLKWEPAWAPPIFKEEPDSYETYMQAMLKQALEHRELPSTTKDAKK